MRNSILLFILIAIPIATFAQSKNTNTMEKSERYQRGWNKLQEIDGESGENVVNGLKDISPAFSQFIIEYPFGDVYAVDKLDDKSKEIAAVASLIAQRAVPEMKVHLNGALNTGSTINEIKEIIIQLASYVGFPKAICAMNTFKEVLAERKEKGITDKEGAKAATNKSSSNRYELGSKHLSILDKNQVQNIEDAYREFLPELADFVIEYAYGDIYSRENLDKKTRQIAGISAFTTISALPQLKFHINAGLNVGLTIEQIKGIMLMMTVYAGFPAAINGTNILKEVVEERNRK